MKFYLKTMVVMAFLTLMQTDINAQCAANMGFDNGNFGSWSTSTDSNFITPASRMYFKPGLSPIIASYGSVDAWLGTISKPSSLCGNYLTRVGNKGLLATADTVYRTYIIDSLSDKLTIYSKGVVELAHNYWGVPIIEAPGFGYEVYVNGKKLDCLKGAFFCGNVDTPHVWNVGNYRDTSTVRKTVGWAKEELNFACFVGDTIEIRLFTRDCILKGHYAYAYFDVVCGDTTKPAITRIMVNDVIDQDRLDLYCTDSTKLFLRPNTTVCPVFRGNVSWSPSSYVFGASNVDSAIFHNIDSMWVYAEATFTNFCTSINVRDSIFIKVNQSDPRDNIPKMPRNFCDCNKDTIDFGTNAATVVRDQSGNTMALNNGAFIVAPCDKFYEEATWKNQSAKIALRKSQIGTVGWVSGNVEGAIGFDSILATGTVRYVINQVAGKRFFAGITTNNVNNSNDMDHAIYYNGGVISAYYRGSLRATLGTFSGTVTVDFKTLIWINNVKLHTYTNAQKAVFPVFPDFAAQSNDTNLISKTYIYGPTKNIKDFTRLLLPTTVKYFISYNDRCGVPVNDTIQIIPGFTTSITPGNVVLCGLDDVNMTVHANGPSIIDDLVATSDGDGDFTVNNPTLYYTPTFTDYANSPVAVYVESESGRCTSSDTAFFTFNEIPLSDAGPDIFSPPSTYSIGGSPSGICGTCASMAYTWSPAVALNSASIANPTVTRALVNSNYFELRVQNPVTNCFSVDTAFILTPLPAGDVNILTRCLSDKEIGFTWTLVPSIEKYSFGIEYSVDNGLKWISAGKITSELNLMNNELKEYSMIVERIPNTQVLYRWYTFNMTGDKKSVIPVYDIECGRKSTFTVFPNPFTSEISLDIHTSGILKADLTVAIFNEYGQKVYDKQIQTGLETNFNQYLLNGTNLLNNGIYYMSITDKDKILFTTKIVKLQ